MRLATSCLLSIMEMNIMSYKLIKVQISNFKYISHDSCLIIDFNDFDLVLLDGPNGYGKSTVFDSLELLITGKIKHFNAELLNRGNDNLGTLANNIQKDIVISGEFIDDSGKIFKIIRTLQCSNNFKDTLSIDGQLIDNDILFKTLGINENMFDMGIYISQSQSLNFLQLKYKDRKSQLSNILSNDDAVNKIKKLIELKKSLDDKRKLELEKTNTLINQQQIKIDEIKNSINKTITVSNLDCNYKKLFADKEIDFDKENIDINIDYDVILTPLLQIEEFLKDYTAFSNITFNKVVDKLLEFDKKYYLSIFFKEKISLIKEKLSEIEEIQKIEMLLTDFEARKFYVNKIQFGLFEVPEGFTNTLVELLEQKNAIIQKMDKNQGYIKDVLEKRGNLLQTFIKATDEDAISKEKCPYCGRISETLSELFFSYQQSLSENLGLLAHSIEEVDNKITSIYDNTIIPLIKAKLASNAEMLRSYHILKPCLDISTVDIYNYIKYIGISIEQFSKDCIFEKFDEQMERLKSEILSKKKVVDKVISPQKMEIHKNIFTQYYKNDNPFHTLLDIENKKIYIAKQYSNAMNKLLYDSENKLKLLSSKHNEVDEKTKKVCDNVKVLLNKYNAAYTKYQNIVATNICVPLYIFSGKIIQNYPLGLGITVRVEDNQIVFQAQGKENDIFNVLSMGQLNGVVLSILLSVKSIFSKTGLSVMLIDDPLQSIDDISAISFSDILATQFKDTQIVLSTHEYDKSELFEFKFKQIGKTVKLHNMQEHYLSTH